MSNHDDARMIREEKRFHGWRLIGVIMIVVVGLALVSATIDWSVIGPLEGRAWDGSAWGWKVD